MSLNLVKKNTTSPFQLQRSMVDQGGAYESGGFSGESQYSDGGASAVVTSIGNSVSAGLNNITSADKNKMNEKKAERLERRSSKTESKMKVAKTAGNTNKADRMQERNIRVETRLNETNKKIKDYKESKNPTLDSYIKPISTKKEVTKTGDKLKETTDFVSPINQKKKKKTNPSQEGPGNSYMIGLPPEVVKENKLNVKKQSSGPRGDYTEKKLPAPKMKRY